MKQFLLFFIILFSFNEFTSAQSLETGIKFYQEGDYQRALQVFDDFDDEPVAHLFTGKTYFGLGNYLKAKHHLAKVDSSYMEVLLEAKYTTALADFQLKNFQAALDELYQIKESRSPASVRRTAISFYFQLMSYLTIDQRYNTFKATNFDEVRLDLVKAAVGNVDFQSAKSLVNYYHDSVVSGNKSDLEQIEEILSDSIKYAERYSPNKYPKAPAGIAYNIGVALPRFDFESPNYELSQNLFFGIQLAVDEFNSNNTEKKAFITFKNTLNADNPQSVVNNLVWNSGVDAILGPLFSEEAIGFSDLAEQYQVPLITPLANADNLNLDQNYTFQLNPTFGVHGKKMAQFAVQDLGYDTLAVIVERGSLGEPSAIEFRNEATKLGAEIIKYYSEDLGNQGYDISEFTDFLNPETDTLTNYHIDAVYAPFTGDAATTLSGSLLTHLEAMRSNITVLGSEEWQNVDFESRNLPNSEMYYSQAFSQRAEDNILENFRSAYQLRFDTNPDFYSMVGYDAARILLETLKTVQNPAYLREGLKNLNNYEGLVTKVSFKNTHINQEIRIRRGSK